METKYILILLLYYVIISVFGVSMTINDKIAAINKKRRIPEARLMLVGLAGAAFPMFIAMNIIHHKTKHPKFMLGLPAETILQCLLIVGVVVLTTHTADPILL